MISTEEIRDKEVINILDGKSLGFVSDIEIDLSRGRVEALIVPAQKSLFGMFTSNDEYIIKWKDIKRIGEDVILAEVRSTCSCEETEEWNATSPFPPEEHSSSRETTPSPGYFSQSRSPQETTSPTDDTPNQKEFFYRKPPSFPLLPRGEET